MTRDVFITEDFLLESEMAHHLFHEYAKDLPIVDYHCHLPPEQIATDHRFANLAEIWLHGDHYKWRAMRACGIAEKYCTGDAPDKEKFLKWAEAVPQLLRNPLYHWTHLELKRPFGISDRLLNPATAEGIWEACNAKLAHPAFSCRGIMKQMNVALVCTTDDPIDPLQHHRIAQSDASFPVKVLPTWRPDKAMAIENAAAFGRWVDMLAVAANKEVRNYDEFMDALRQRHAYFHEMGCRLSDYGLETVYADDYTANEVNAIFAKVRDGKTPDNDEIRTFKSAMLHEFALMDHERGWTQQLHLGPLRNTNSLMFAKLGPDKGYDSIGDYEIARPLCRFLDRLNSTDQLARTIVYNLNPRDNELLVTMMGNFQDGITPGKMQHGSAWWFLDQMDGMQKQLESLSQLGVLSKFVGMLTDSRSFLSYTRHEYFRRILCNMLGNDMTRGLLPSDIDLVGGMVRDICYNNAATYFGFDLPVLPNG